MVNYKFHQILFQTHQLMAENNENAYATNFMRTPDCLIMDKNENL